MRRYLVVIENAGDNYAAYVPDLPGCITTGATVEKAAENMVEAISLHLETMAEFGISIPEPVTTRDALATSSEMRFVEIALRSS